MKDGEFHVSEVKMRELEKGSRMTADMFCNKLSDPWLHMFLNLQY